MDASMFNLTCRRFGRALRGFLFLALAASVSAQSAGDFATVRARFRAGQTGGDNLNAADATLSAKVATLNATAQTHWTNLNKSTTRISLWSDLTVTAGKSDTITPLFDRIKTLAAAYATNGAALKGNTALRDDTVSALQWLNTNHYSSSRPFFDNWFPWHLGIPLTLVDTFACLHDGLTAATRTSLYSSYAAAIDFYQSTAGPTFANTGANRVWRSRIDVGLGAALESPSRLAAGRDKLSVVLPYVTSGDGFYTDGSFIQHNTHSYTGGYGLYLIGDLSAVLEAVAGTPWAVTDPNLANVFRWVEDAYDPVIFRGAIMDMTRGREISRSGSTDHAAGHPTLTAIARVAQFADAETAARLRAIVKGNIQSDAFRNFIASAGLSAAGLVKPLLDDPAIGSRAPRIGCFVFAGMDRVVHQRGDWAYGISLSSKRISKYESINAENLRGWYLGDGASYLYNGDLAQYADQYWPTVDPYRLAGTTVDTRRLADAGTRSPNTTDPRTSKAWVGGSTVLGEFGSAGMDHEAAQSDLRAKKSWFLFDNEVVHLGAGIVTSADNPNAVETIVENRRIGGAGNSGASVFTANGAIRAATAGTTENLASVAYAHMAAPMQAAFGNGDIGYFFPSPATLQARRETRTGRYTDINQGPFTNSTLQSRAYLTLWFDHSAQLTAPGASYSYVVLPGATPAQTAAYAQSPDVEILANTTSVQAVRDRALKATGLNFWAPTTVADFSCDSPASLTVLERDGQLHLGLSDPTQENTNAITIELPYGAESVVAADSRVTVVSLAPRLRLQIAVAGTRGRSVPASFRLIAPVTSAPVIAGQPASVALAAGTTVAFNVNAVAQPAATYQWSKDGVPVVGATGAALILPGISAADVASYTCLVANGLGSVTTNPAKLTLAGAVPDNRPRLANLSIRSVAGIGDQTLTVGFVMGGAGTSGARPLLIRGIGPALAGFGVTSVLADPALTVFAGQTVVAANDNWGGDAQIAAVASAVGAFALPSVSGADAALLRNGLEAGAYTVQITGVGAATGTALAEIYDANPAGVAESKLSRLINLSARARVGTGSDVLVAGFVISGALPQTMLIRAIGPTLTAFGVGGVLADPRLEIYSGPTKIYENDDWGGATAFTTVANRIGAFPLPASSRDAGLILTLPPGAYTVHVSGANPSSGVCLIEVYEVP